MNAKTHPDWKNVIEPPNREQREILRDQNRFQLHKEYKVILFFITSCVFTVLSILYIINTG